MSSTRRGRVWAAATTARERTARQIMTTQASCARGFMAPSYREPGRAVNPAADAMLAAMPALALPLLVAALLAPSVPEGQAWEDMAVRLLRQYLQMLSGATESVLGRPLGIVA